MLHCLGIWPIRICPLVDDQLPAQSVMVSNNLLLRSEAKRMTAKEQLISMLEKSGLTRQQEIVESVWYDKYSVNKRQVLLGSGGGYAGMWVRFDFDTQGNLIGHSVNE